MSLTPVMVPVMVESIELVFTCSSDRMSRGVGKIEFHVLNILLHNSYDIIVPFSLTCETPLGLMT